MKRSLLPSLRCVSCTGGRLTLQVTHESAVEVRTGRLTCADCGSVFEIRDGILDVLDPSDDTIRKEIHGWIELAGPLEEHLVSQMAALPYFPQGPWPHTAPDFFQIFEIVDFAEKSVVDIGAGRTWSSRFLATIGRAGEVVAVDVLKTRFLGLETAEIFFHDDGSHFERIAGDIHNIPLVEGWADVVFSCAAIHHSSGIEALFREIWRILKPGGLFVFVSEPSKKASIKERQPVNAETAHGINEHIYSFDEYMSALRATGFQPRQLSPRSIRYRLLYPDAEFREGVPSWLWRFGRTAVGRRIVPRLLGGRHTGPILYRIANLPLSVIAKRPGA